MSHHESDVAPSASSGASGAATHGVVDYPAKFLDGWTAHEHAVVVQVEPGALRIVARSGRELGHWNVAGLTIDGLQEGGLVHVGHTSVPEELLTVSDPALRRHLLALDASTTRVPGGARRGWFALACLIAISALMGGAYLAVPKVARAIAIRIPLERERALGMQAEALLSYGYCEDGKARAALHEVAKRLSGKKGSAPEVRIIHAGAPNAFALPGGLILVTDAFLHQAETADEVAGVLAHEIQHVTQRHVLAGFVRDTILSAVWALTIGDYAGMMVLDPSTAYHIANLKFSREDEASADRGAIQMLHAAGISHRGLSEFFARLHKEHGDEVAWLSTHPSTEERIKSLKASPDVKASRTFLSIGQWDALKQACAGDD